MNRTLPILSELGQAAMRYAERGLFVFPIKAGHKGEELPDPASPGGVLKTHLLPHGHLGASNDPAQVRKWWTRHPEANIGVYLAKSNLVAVDADLYKPECQWGNFVEGIDLPDTLVQRSARGGIHYIFKAAPGEEFKGELPGCPGVDVKHKGYILLEPSRFEGGVYQFQTDTKPVPAPSWVPRKERPLSEQAAGTGPAVLPEDRKKVLALLGKARNTLARDPWVKLCHAVKDTLGDSGRAAWVAFSDRYEGDQKPGEAERVWDTAKPDGTAKIGSIFHLLTPATEEPRQASRQGEGRSPLAGLKSFRALQSMTFAPVKFIVPGFLPEGLTVFIGPPKIGKSWLVLGTAKAVGSGGEVLGQKCERGAVLYLALEDNDRRLQGRLDTITADEQWPDAAVYETRWPRLDQGGYQAIVEWIDTTPNARLIIIDTLKMVRPPSKKGQGVYDSDVELLRPLQQLASSRGIAIVVIHHTKKGAADDPLELVSGTNGLTGTADTTLVLTRRNGGKSLGHLHARGRDLEEFDRDVKLVEGVWEIDGDPLDANKGDSTRAILKAIRDGARTPKAIEAATGLKGQAIRKTLGRMVARGDVTKTGRGDYEAGGAEQPSQPSQPGQREGTR